MEYLTVLFWSNNLDHVDFFQLSLTLDVSS